MEEAKTQPIVRMVSGEVFVLESGDAIPDAEATVFDITGVHGARRDGDDLNQEDLKWVLTGMSLGSSITNEDGHFEVGFSERDEPSPRDLIVVVTASREAEKAATRLLYISPRARRSIALSEAFVIGVPAERIAAAPANPGQALRKTAGAAFRAARANRTALRDTVRGSIETRRTGIAEARTNVHAALRERAKKRFEKAGGVVAENYVTETSDVRRTQIKALRKTLSRTGAIRMEAEIDPDAEGRAALVDNTGAAVPGLTSANIRKILFDRNRHPAASDWRFHDKIALDCRKRYTVKRFSPIPPGVGGNGGGGAPDEPQPATSDDVKRHLTSLLNEIEAAGDPGGTNEASGTLAGINGFVHGLEITGGAADQTSVFDFETLNFAFDHVWQDIFDPWWSTLLADRMIEVGKITAHAAPPVNGGGPKRNLIDELAYQTQTMQAAALAEFGREGAPGVSYSIIGDALNGISSVADAVAHAAGSVVDIVTPGGGGRGTGPRVRDHRDRDDNRGRVRDHRGRGTARSRGKRMQILNAYLKALDDVIVSDYPFTVFGADDSGRAINYGQLIKYRQRWSPKTYQAGELIKTLPLAPRQKMTFSSKRTTRETYSEKRAKASENTYNSEDNATTRDVAKIVNSAKLETAYTLENKANASVPGVGGGDSTTTFNTNFGLQSSRTKETFREQVRKESESFKNSTSINVETTESSELVEEESGEIQNPNDEIAFTCLFYELQRRYDVSEKLHKLTPVILVAEDVWKPSDITPETIARYDWILRRVLLDEGYESGLDIIGAGSWVAEQAGLADLEDMMEEQFGVVEDLRRQLQRGRSLTITPRRRRSRSIVEIGLELVGLGGAETPSAQSDSVLDEDEQRKNELEDELRRQEGLLAQAVEQFNEAFKRFAAQVILVKKLQLHIKENIIYYMQAIWDHEDNHQMLMRLRNTQVPVITGSVVYSVSGVAPHEEPPFWTKPIRLVARARNFEVSDDTVDLAEVADLSRPIGFFGNYRIFPLIQINPVSEILLVPFLSGRAGVHDPDAASNVTVGDLERYADCLRDTMDDAGFQAVWPKILATLERRLDNARPDSEEIVIPTGSLFIELLPGAHSAMEAFKRQHRGVDVADAVADVITKRLDHLRVAARIATDKLGDPTTEKVIVADPDKIDLDDL